MSAQPTYQPGEAYRIPVDQLIPDPDQPRKVFRAKQLDELAENIKARGQLQPILVRVSAEGQLIIKSGERRWRAHQRAGLSEIRAVIDDASDESVSDRLVDQISENQFRQDLSPLELAASYARLRDDDGMQPADIRKHLLSHGIDVSRSQISNTLRLLELPGWAREALERGEIGAAHARVILSAKDWPAWAERVRLDYEDWQKHRDEGDFISVARMEVLVSHALYKREVAAPLDAWPHPAFDVETVCAKCPNLLRRNGRTYCMAPEEFEARQKEARAAQAKAAEAKAPEPTTPTRRGEHDSNREERERAAEIENAYRFELYQRLRPMLLGPIYADLATTLIDLQEYQESLDVVCRLRGIEVDLDPAARLRAEVQQLDKPGELMSLINDLMYAGELDLPPWAQDRPPAMLLALAKEYGIDANAVRQEVAARHAAAKKPAKPKKAKAS